jgi:lipid II:glycine glycyltransferase (peptidoglycan interpeptide bridge formation enzyme)
MGVIEATLLVDVSRGKEAFERGMNKDTRRRIRLAQKNGIIIREGNEKDVALFFALMNATCKRRGVRTNPAREETLGRLLSAFSARNCLRVTFAEHNRDVIAGIMSIPFGEKVNVWKKGWNYTHHDSYPNDLLYYDTLQWACSNKFDHCDFAGFDRNIACCLIKGQPLSVSQKRSRDIFNLRFGGVPKLLPHALIWFTNPIFLFLYRHIVVRTKLLEYLRWIRY